MSQRSRLHDDTSVYVAEHGRYYQVQRLLSLLRLSAPTQVDALGRIKFGEFDCSYPASLDVKITNKAQD